MQTNVGKIIIGLLMLIAVMVTYSYNVRSSGALPPPAASGPNSAKLTWDVPQKRTDNTALTTIRGYKIYYGTNSGAYSKAVIIPIDQPALSCQNIDGVGKQNPDKKQCSYVVQGLGKGSYYFSVTVYDDKGNESDFSNEVIRQFK